ncbi:tRNA isopentenyltransferase [Acrodontium crateriforme]|uniref:tRNA dimethylallyltransferase n=1 Tax=Acrodontium crateriforme TaxID=150365 RepID=A0AAQ3LZT3_9PEZI|nr:tRNA isopentenyltransferase [Acrodontium crateriforme]
MKPRLQPKLPLIAVVGATGTGKSELAVELAKVHNGEIINGDAMQLYSGLPIITNKITPAEQQGIAHHLIGRICFNEQTWVVGTFVKQALSVIDQIRARGKLPILVGGTHYYTQSLLFHDRLVEGNDDANTETQNEDHQEWPELEQPTEELLEELKRVDPIMAERWHPNDRRKIQRSLQIYLKTGRKASDLYAEQRARNVEDTSPNGDLTDTDGPKMRFDTLMFWVHAESDALRDRLDKRVDKMLAAGLLDEVQQLYSHAAAETTQSGEVDETRGIWISIGYKEFKTYMEALNSCTEANQADLERLKREALERTKIATRQYAKRQIRWLRIKMINSLHCAHAQNSLYLLDGTDVAEFASKVVQPALALTKTWLCSSDTLPEPTSLSAAASEMLVPKREDYSAAPESWTKQHCDICNTTCVTAEQWQTHVRSRGHRRGVAKRGGASISPIAATKTS